MLTFRGPANEVPIKGETLQKESKQVKSDHNMKLKSF